MKKEYLFDKVSELKERFRGFFQHRKKITALENYSNAEKFPHKNLLVLVKNCMNEGFLEEKESEFLDHMLNKYEVNYLDWAHKTKWLKQQIEARKAARPTPMQTFFSFEKQDSTVYVPLEILNAKTAQQIARV